MSDTCANNYDATHIGAGINSGKQQFSRITQAKYQEIGKIKEFWFLLCFIEVFSKYIYMDGTFENQKSITTTNKFQKTLNESGGKPKKSWADKCGKF